MPFYQRLGDLPRKRHIVHRDNGTLLTEEVMGFEGFSGLESILYHLQSPCRVIEPSGAVGIAAVLNGLVSGDRIGVIVSGGNVGAARFAELIA